MTYSVTRNEDGTTEVQFSPIGYEVTCFVTVHFNKDHQRDGKSLTEFGDFGIAMDAMVMLVAALHGAKDGQTKEHPQL